MKAASMFNSLPSIFASGLVIAGIEAPRGWTVEHGPGPAEFGVLGTPSIILFQGRKGNIGNWIKRKSGSNKPIIYHTIFIFINFLEIARYNESEHNFELLKNWVVRTTKLVPQQIPETFNHSDYTEPVPLRFEILNGPQI